MFIQAHLDILVLTEIWLDKTIEGSEILPSRSGLLLLRTDRNRNGGGVVFVISNLIPFNVIPELSEGSIKSLWIELFPCSKRSLLAGGVYGPPSKTGFYNSFTLVCEKGLQSINQKILILGDLNSDLLHPTLP